MFNATNTYLRKFLIAYETKWRSRVGTTNPYDVDPYARVGQNEMADWCAANGVNLNPLFDAAELQPKLRELWKRLEQEFPNEGWAHFGNPSYAIQRKRKRKKIP